MFKPFYVLLSNFVSKLLNSLASRLCRALKTTICKTVYHNITEKDSIIANILSFFIAVTLIVPIIPSVFADPLDTVEFSSPAGVTLSDNALFDVKEALGDNNCIETGEPIQITTTGAVDVVQFVS